MTARDDDAGMSTTTSHTTFDARELRRAFADHDVPALLALFADDATVEIADSEHPPSSPLVVDGRDAIRAWVEDILGRDMTHEIDTVAVDGDALGYTLRCR